MAAREEMEEGRGDPPAALGGRGAGYHREKARVGPPGAAPQREAPGGSTEVAGGVRHGRVVVGNSCVAAPHPWRADQIASHPAPLPWRRALSRVRCRRRVWMVEAGGVAATGDGGAFARARRCCCSRDGSRRPGPPYGEFPRPEEGCGGRCRPELAEPPGFVGSRMSKRRYATWAAASPDFITAPYQCSCSTRARGTGSASPDERPINRSPPPHCVTSRPSPSA